MKLDDIPKLNNLVRERETLSNLIDRLAEFPNGSVGGTAQEIYKALNMLTLDELHTIKNQIVDMLEYDLASIANDLSRMGIEVPAKSSAPKKPVSRAEDLGFNKRKQRGTKR